MPTTLPLLIFMSVLFPAKLWVAPGQPLVINVKGSGDYTMVLTNFAGRVILPSGDPGSNATSAKPANAMSGGSRSYSAYAA